VTGARSIGQAESGRRILSLAVLALILACTAASALIAQFDFTEGLASFPKALTWMAQNFVPDARAWAHLPQILQKLGETVLVSVMATTAAAAASLGLAVLGSRTTRFHVWATPLVRALASVARNIPVVAWAMIFLLAFGQIFLTGFLALFLESLGFLTRSYLEALDETAAGPVEALKAAGVRWGPVVSQAVVPSVLPGLTSWMLFMLETNIRSATLVGLLTGTGIGFLFDLYYKSLNYPSAALTTLAIVVVVLVLEAGSNQLRKVIL
jgi:phosphonate transport system permease protein